MLTVSWILGGGHAEMPRGGQRDYFRWLLSMTEARTYPPFGMQTGQILIVADTVPIWVIWAPVDGSWILTQLGSQEPPRVNSGLFTASSVIVPQGCCPGPD
jgi:hypothetical protein